MVEELTRAIGKLLSSTDPEEVAAGLDKVWARLPRASADEKCQYVEMASALFYIDTLDRPEYLPVVEDAIGMIGSIGEVAIPILMQELEGGDVKAQMAIGQALGRMGADAIPALLEQYHEVCPEASCRAFILYALGKIKSRADRRSAADRARSSRRGRPGSAGQRHPRAGQIRGVDSGRQARRRKPWPPSSNACGPISADGSPALRAKAVRTLGKLARYGHLSPEQCEQLTVTLHRILGEDEHFEWDRAYVVRKEAREALQYV